MHRIVYRACGRDLDQTRLRVFAHDRRAIGQGARCLAERRCGAGVVAEMVTGLAEAGMNGGSRGAARDGGSQQSCSLVEAPLLGVEQPQSGSGFRQLGLQLERIAEGALGGGHVLALIVQAGEIDPDVQLQRIELHRGRQIVHRLRVPAGCAQHAAEIGQDLGLVRCRVHGQLEDARGVIQAPVLPQRQPEVAQRLQGRGTRVDQPAEVRILLEPGLEQFGNFEPSFRLANMDGHAALSFGGNSRRP